MDSTWAPSEEDIQITLKEAMAGKITDAMLEDQLTKYHTGRDGSTGHGFVAEDVNARIERLAGKDVEKVGVDNKKNGADRITDGRMIQSKYCRTAHSTVEAAFGEDGMYRYKVRNGRPMALEVPRDQYDRAVELMKQKIKDGKVPNVKNPEHARKMVKKGFLTYQQSLDAARSGNLTSITYDAMNGAVIGLYSFGISGTITYLSMVRKGATQKEALVESAKVGGKSFGITVGTNVAVSQAEKFLNDVAADGLRQTVGNFHLLPKEASKAAGSAARKAAQTTAGKVVEEGAKKGSKEAVKKGAGNFIKSGARANVIAGAVTTAVLSVPDVRKAVKGEISAGECVENIAENGASVAAGMAAFAAGTEAGGMVGTKLGAIAGSVFGPAGSAIGAAGGFLTGTAIGLVGSVLSSKAIHKGRAKIDEKRKKNRAKKSR